MASEQQYHEVTEAQMVVVNILKKSIQSLQKYPKALDAYLRAEKEIFAESQGTPILLRSLLYTLRAQRTLLEAMHLDTDAYSTFEKAEHIALNASRTIHQMVKEGSPEFEDFLNAESIFYHSYTAVLEKPMDNIHALYDFLSTEITTLEGMQVKNNDTVIGQRVMINALKSSFATLAKHPKALSAFLDAQKTIIEEKAIDEYMSQSLIDAHIIILQAQKAVLKIYETHPDAYKIYMDAEQQALAAKKDIAAKLYNPTIKKQFNHRLAVFEAKYRKLIQDPLNNMASLQNFLDSEIRQLQAKALHTV